KMIRRHPHVFGDEKADHPDQVVANWTRIKREEKEARGEGAAAPSVFDGLPRAMPALLRADRMNTKAARVGFEWERIEDVWAKVDEELGELREAVAQADADGIEEEVGDLLITVANLARWLGVHPETALHRSLDKFDRRFRAVERALAAEGRSVEDADLAEMDAHWNRVKAGEAGKR
ncbi:MAG: MazG family protein, partial [Myxococcales bacterium]|nr:MazG family protein [Myxococcales bacterium]